MMGKKTFKYKRGTETQTGPFPMPYILTINDRELASLGSQVSAGRGAYLQATSGREKKQGNISF